MPIKQANTLLDKSISDGKEYFLSAKNFFIATSIAPLTNGSYT